MAHAFKAYFARAAGLAGLLVVAALGVGLLVMRQSQAPHSTDRGAAALPAAPDGPAIAAHPIEPASPEPATAMPIRAVDAAAPAPPSNTSSHPSLQRLSVLESHIAKLHADCLKQGASPQCSASRWWEVTVLIHENNELSRPDLVHLRELYLAVSRAWRGNLEGGVAANIDRELTIKLMDRAREWRR